MVKRNSNGTLQLHRVTAHGLTALDTCMPTDEMLLTRCRVVGGSSLEGACAAKVPVIPAHRPAAPVYPAPMVVHIIPAHNHDSNTHNKKTTTDNVNFKHNDGSCSNDSGNNNKNDDNDYRNKNMA